MPYGPYPGGYGPIESRRQPLVSPEPKLRYIEGSPPYNPYMVRGAIASVRQAFLMAEEGKMPMSYAIALTAVVIPLLLSCGLGWVPPVIDAHQGGGPDGTPGWSSYPVGPQETLLPPPTPEATPTFRPPLAIEKCPKPNESFLGFKVIVTADDLQKANSMARAAADLLGESSEKALICVPSPEGKISNFAFLTPRNAIEFGWTGAPVLQTPDRGLIMLMTPERFAKDGAWVLEAYQKEIKAAQALPDIRISVTARKMKVGPISNGQGLETAAVTVPSATERPEIIAIFDKESNLWLTGQKMIDRFKSLFGKVSVAGQDENARALWSTAPKQIARLETLVSDVVFGENGLLPALRVTRAYDANGYPVLLGIGGNVDWSQFSAEATDRWQQEIESAQGRLEKMNLANPQIFVNHNTGKGAVSLYAFSAPEGNQVAWLWHNGSWRKVDTTPDRTMVFDAKSGTFVAKDNSGQTTYTWDAGKEKWVEAIKPATPTPEKPSCLAADKFWEKHYELLADHNLTDLFPKTGSRGGVDDRWALGQDLPPLYYVGTAQILKWDTEKREATLRYKTPRVGGKQTNDFLVSDFAIDPNFKVIYITDGMVRGVPIDACVIEEAKGSYFWILEENGRLVIKAAYLSVRIKT